ncbi:MAG: DUF4199 domain-containing protein [Saprospiraceae bacterium]
MIDQETPDSGNVSPRPVSQKYGLMWGGASILLSLAGYLSGMDPQLPDTSLSVKVVFGLVGFAIPIWAIVSAVKEHRDQELGGYISVGRGLGVGTLTGLFAGLVGAVWMLIFNYLIAPDYINVLLDAQSSQFEFRNVEEQIEMALSFSSMMYSPPVQAISQVIGSVLFGLIIGLIVALIMKRDRPV